MRSHILRDGEALVALSADWGALWRESALRPLTLHPAWVESWVRALGGEGELLVVTCHDRALDGVAPLYIRPPRGGALRVREVGLLGDGIVGVRGAVLARSGTEPEVLDAVVAALLADRSWDLLDLTLVDPEQADGLEQRFVAHGQRVDRIEMQGRPLVSLARPLPPAPAWDGPAAVACEAAALPHRIGNVAELSRRSAAARIGEPAFVSFLSRAAPALSANGLLSLWSIESGGKLAAAHVLLRDGDRRIELLRGVAPGWASAGDALLHQALRRAAEEGALVFELADEPPEVSTGTVQGLRLRIFSDGATKGIRTGYASIERQATAVADAARAELDRVKDATVEIVERAVARVAVFSKMHLYRGELFVRNAPPPPGVTLRLFTLADFEALPDQGAFLHRLDLEATYCRQKWERGDLVVVAEIADPASPDNPPEIAGIVWCARFPVFVPEIGRDVRPLGGECYIHDVYVAPSARGRALAPAMLEFLARQLRGRDVYRAWALIERSNTASIRAFEKAAYAATADVIFARMGLATKLLVRPPDAEARSFLGLK